MCELRSIKTYELWEPTLNCNYCLKLKLFWNPFPDIHAGPFWFHPVQVLRVQADPTHMPQAAFVGVVALGYHSACGVCFPYASSWSHKNWKEIQWLIIHDFSYLYMIAACPTCMQVEMMVWRQEVRFLPALPFRVDVALVVDYLFFGGFM